jgi:hypothetical protein
MSGYHLAQINVGRFIHLRDDPANADFMSALDPVNAEADTAPGFIWRMVGDGDDATDIVPDVHDPKLLVNMSVWRDVETLGAFVYRNAEHLSIMRRRKEWFDKIEIFQALWWNPTGHIPSVAEGMERIERIRKIGPSADAFTFQNSFPSPDGSQSAPILDACA